ncbi:hypothetical protein HN51_015007 [Arachis hypogaea]|uniref:CASP-like protein n=2 Tax=Arachis TaxID=3817 RepID=A0A445CMB0_ARAHY|nr:CASP-like protein 1E1 [Arachis duranensis]XP_025604148.1 CASP-like protein 1E1 [Arachis hypogaea]RYR52057.1 hypothetical protein Ahy_A06g026982 [Arachis hypogaea]
MGSSSVEGGGLQSNVKVVERAILMGTTRRPCEVVVRLLGLFLTLVATIIVGVDKETKIISYAGIDFKATAKWEYLSATVFLLVSNAIACSYAAASLVMLEMAKRRRNDNNDVLSTSVVEFGVTVMDLVMMGLLFSANGAAAAVGVIAQNGNSHIQWMKVCNVFDAYCRHMTAAFLLSFFASVSFLFMVLFSLVKLHYYKFST